MKAHVLIHAQKVGMQKIIFVKFVMFLVKLVLEEVILNVHLVMKLNTYKMEYV